MQVNYGTVTDELLNIISKARASKRFITSIDLTKEELDCLEKENKNIYFDKANLTYAGVKLRILK